MSQVVKTTNDFKSFFYRDDFNFNPYTKYDSSTTYSLDDQVYSLIFKKVYKSKQNSNTGQALTDASYWGEETGIDLFSFVLDEDIDMAYQKANYHLQDGFNESLESGNTYTDQDRAFFYLSGHMIFMMMAEKGGGTLKTVTSISGDGLSESYVQDREHESEFINSLSLSSYGKNYLLMYDKLRVNQPTIAVI